MKTARIIAIGLILTSSSFAGENYSRTTEDISLSSRHESRNPNLVPGIFKQVIDHSESLTGPTFDQRFWIDSEYASPSPDAPVIYHVCGEGNAEVGYFLNDNAIEWAKTLGAHLVYLEHRYYGKSQPFSDLSAEHLAFLTLNNVIEDLASFQKWISSNQGWSGKWISVGGSYSGTISAIYRQTHPELVVGALAASAPMISGIGPSVGSQSDVNDLSYTDPANDSGDRPWAYQACTTFGFWEAIGMTFRNPSTWLCQQLFGNVALANSAMFNQTHDLPFISDVVGAPSQILFTYGSVDVWTKLGLSTQTNANSKITIQVIKDAGHHFDLNAPTGSDTTAVKAARNTFLTLAKEWLQ